MSDLFDINAPSNSIFLNELRRGEGVVVITSKAEKKLQGRVMIEAKNPLVEEMVAIVDGERTFLPKEAQQFAIRVEMPPIMPGGTYQFRVQVMDVDSPDDTFQNGPEILFVAPHPAKFGAMAAAIVGVILVLLLLVGGIIGMIVLLSQPQEIAIFDSQLAFTTVVEGKERIYLYLLGRENEHPIDVRDDSEVGLQFNNHSPAWSPEGRRLAFISDRESNTWSIYIYNITDKGIRRIDVNIVDVVALAWSPDGERMVYLKRSGGIYELYQMEANGDAPVNLYETPNMLYSLSYYPDGRGLTFVENNLIYYLPFGNASTPLPLMPPEYQLANFGYPVEIAWSEGGDVLAIASLTELANRRQVSVYRIDFIETSSSELQYQEESLLRLTFGENDRVPFWSLDGQRILFVSSSRDDNSYLPDVYVMLARADAPITELPLPEGLAIFQPNLQPNFGSAAQPTATPTVTDTPSPTPSPTATATEAPQ